VALHSHARRRGRGLSGDGDQGSAPGVLRGACARRDWPLDHQGSTVFLRLINQTP
jgi:hypothetical protein